MGGELDILAPRSLIALVNHFRGTQVLARPEPAIRASARPSPDLRDIKGQESAKRALEIAAAGGHNLLMSRPAGLGQVDARPAPALDPAAALAARAARNLDDRTRSPASSPAAR